jgi:hypothetical protein
MPGCTRVGPSDLPGTWVIKAAYRRVLPAELQRAAATLTLEGVGTFVASDLPGLFYVPGRHSVQPQSGSGVWRLVSREGERQLQLDFQTITGWKDVLPYDTHLDASRGSLFYFLGDPDERRKVSFEKK